MKNNTPQNGASKLIANPAGLPGLNQQFIIGIKRDLPAPPAKLFLDVLNDPGIPLTDISSEVLRCGSPQTFQDHPREIF